MMCVQCEKRATFPDGTWPHGWGCLFGMLAACSHACAEKFAASVGRVLADGDFDDADNEP